MLTPKKKPVPTSVSAIECFGLCYIFLLNYAKFLNASRSSLVLISQNSRTRPLSIFVAMRRHDFLLLLAFLAGINGGNGAAQPLRFLYPDRDDLDFLPGDVINLSYETNFTEPYLITWCMPGNASREQYIIIVNFFGLLTLSCRLRGYHKNPCG